MAAFDAAIAKGLGIECDVRLSRDGQPFVFHDASLMRMAGQAGAVADRDAAELDALRLPDGGAIPRLTALLDACITTPLLIEIKVEGRDVAPTCSVVARTLDGRDQPVAVMSFNPLAMRWFAQHRPDMVRGLVSSSQNKGRLRALFDRTLALWLANPDFLACDIRDLPFRFADAVSRRGLPVLSWTVRSTAQRAIAAAHADQIIFEEMA